MKNTLKISRLIVTVALTGVMVYVIVTGVSPQEQFASAFLLAFGAMIGTLYNSSDRKNNNTPVETVAKEE